MNQPSEIIDPDILCCGCVQLAVVYDAHLLIIQVDFSLSWRSTLLSSLPPSAGRNLH
jgi:hypothetical protein